MSKECDVCCGLGDYPIINRKGHELYSIRCPECAGTGMELDPDPEPEFDEQRSTAASIKSVDEMRDHIAKHWR